VDQVRFDSSAFNSSGDIYNNGDLSGAPSSGETIGVFEATEGLHKFYPPNELLNPLSTVGWSYMPNIHVTVGGAELGTTADDEIIFLPSLTQTACAQINKGLTGSTTIPASSVATPINRTFETLMLAGGFASIATWVNYQVGIIPGCNLDSTWGYIYMDIIKQN